MQDSEIYEILHEHSKVAQKRQFQLRTLILLISVYMFILTLVTCLVLVNLANDYDENYNKAVEINKDLTEVLERRSPILEYLKCEDDLEHLNDIALRQFIFAQIDVAYEPTEENLLALSQARVNYNEINSNLLKAESCPDLPS